MNGLSEHIATLVMGDRGKPRKVNGQPVETPAAISRERVDALLAVVQAVCGDQEDAALVAVGTLEAFQRAVGNGNGAGY